MNPFFFLREISPDLKLLRKSFLLFSLTVFCFIPFDLLALSFEGKPKLAPGALASIPDSISPPESLSSYEQAFQTSSFFGLAKPDAPLSVLKSSIAELTKDYRLKGVVIMDQSEAIVEDARTQKSTFVRVGDKLGELEVKEIKEGSIILTYYGEEKEMRIE